MNAVDVRGLPSYKFSHCAVTWWGMMGMIAIEATIVATAIAA